MKQTKQVIAGFLVFAILIATYFMPMTAKAEVDQIDGENGSIYIQDEENYSFATLWAEKKAPAKDGYVFAGWYERNQDDTFTALTPETASNVTTAYAKFVPSYVLSVRAQLQAATETGNGNTDQTYLRVITSVPTNDYEVGFDIWYNKKIKEDETTKVEHLYTSIRNAETNSKPITPQAVFGEASQYFGVLRIKGIKSTNYEKVIYVRPYWITKDGTRVEGQAKYVRVMDGYVENHYISVPINLVAGDEVAAGTTQMTYDAEKLEYVGWDTGLLLPEMDINVNQETGVIKFVGNTTGVTDVKATRDIYANVWFRRKTEVDSSTQWSFGIDHEDFCNWTETTVTNVVAWDVLYKEQ